MKNGSNGAIALECRRLVRDYVSRFRNADGVVDFFKGAGFHPYLSPLPGKKEEIVGGVVINQRCETGIHGLYAAAEVAAGIHGANGLAGNTLTETQVFGAIAGKYAAKGVLLVSSTSYRRAKSMEQGSAL